MQMFEVEKLTFTGTNHLTINKWYTFLRGHCGCVKEIGEGGGIIL